MGWPAAAGRAAHLRVNDRSYLAVYEARSGAMWRLETTGRGAHHGLVADGTAESFDDAKQAVRAALRERFPDAARAVEADVSAPVAPQHGWVPLPGGRDDRTECRVFDERVSAMIAPGPGGRWGTWVSTDGKVTQGALMPTADDARELADAMGRGALMTLAAAAPDRANAVVRDLADAGTLTRADLDQLLGARLGDADRARLQSPETSPADLADALVATGALGPSTVVAVLHHEGVDAQTAAGLVPAIGLPVPDAIRELHARWGMDRLDAGRHLSATPDELRHGGCSPVEMLQAAPREVLRRLDTRVHTWEVAGMGLLETGMSSAEAIRQLALHAPTPETFAAGVCEIEVNPHLSFPTAAREASLPDLVALSERYGLSPAGTAEVLATSCAPTPRGVRHPRRASPAATATTRRRSTPAGRCSTPKGVTQRALRKRASSPSAEPTARRSPSAPPVVDGDENAQLRDALGAPADAATGAGDLHRRRADRRPRRSRRSRRRT